MKDSDSHLHNLTTQLDDLQNHCGTLQEELRSANQSLVEAREEGSRLHDLERQARSSLDQAKERQVCVCVYVVCNMSYSSHLLCLWVGGSVRATGQP